MKSTLSVEYWVAHVNRGYSGSEENYQADKAGAIARVKELAANDMVRTATLTKRVIVDVVLKRTVRRQRDLRLRD